ncbi:hypothetical protein KBD71_05610 [Candidatus Woesebacteria bacterium]|nr:hypothetical protein [Candidatus Woesebacteria bacterium]
MPLTEYSRDQFDGTKLSELLDTFNNLILTRPSFNHPDLWNRLFDSCVLRIFNQIKSLDPLKRSPDVIMVGNWRIEYINESLKVGLIGNPLFLEAELQYRHIIRVNPRD